MTIAISVGAHNISVFPAVLAVLVVGVVLYFSRWRRWRRRNRPGDHDR